MKCICAGTVLQGGVEVGAAVEIPTLRQSFKIKSLQSFKEDVTSIVSGDRAGMCLAQLQASKLERTFVSAPGLLRTMSSCVCVVEKCRFYHGAQTELLCIDGNMSASSLEASHVSLGAWLRVCNAHTDQPDMCSYCCAAAASPAHWPTRAAAAGEVRSRQKLHVTLGHQTRMAWAQFFGEPDDETSSQETLLAGMFDRVGKHARCKHDAFDTAREYVQQDKLYGLEGASPTRAHLVCFSRMQTNRI
jgi:hypothetical protein